MTIPIRDTETVTGNILYVSSKIRSKDAAR